MSAKEARSTSTRGGEEFSDGEWNYSYNQEGDKSEFSGYEEIHLNGELVFFHRVIGGIIRHYYNKGLAQLR